jgi:predicted nucleic acid-binding Zn finger protein
VKLTKNNNEIKSVYDPQLQHNKRLESAKKMLEKIDKDTVFADKKSTFFAVKASKDNGYYSVKQNKENWICDCFDYVHYIEINPKHQCKHIIFIKLLVDKNQKIPLKDLTNLLDKEIEQK